MTDTIIRRIWDRCRSSNGAIHVEEHAEDGVSLFLLRRVVDRMDRSRT